MLVTSLVLAATLAGPAAKVGDFVGRWNVRITNAEGTFRSGGFEIAEPDAGLRAGIVWRWGSYGPAKSVSFANGVLTLSRDAEKKGEVDVFALRLEGGALKGTATYADGKTHDFEGRRAPALARDKPVAWGDPVALFDGRSLEGWGLRDPAARMGWAVVDGELAVVEPKGNADLVSSRSFGDMRLHLEFQLDPKSNSGVYLRGRYEIQLLDDRALATESHGCGALYSRAAPALDAAKGPGEWQSLDITFVGRQLSVVLNGKTILDDVLVEGITGGALDPFEETPGPLMLQGDHGKVRFRNIIVTPAR